MKKGLKMEKTDLSKINIEIEHKKKQNDFTKQNDLEPPSKKRNFDRIASIEKI